MGRASTVATDPLGRALRHSLLCLQGGDSLTDSQLLERFASRHEEAAFAELVRRHGPMVLRTCQRVLGNRPDVDDAFQATFIVLARKAPALTAALPLGGWLHRVAQRISLRARFTAGRRRERSLDDTVPPAAIPSPSAEPSEVLDEELNGLSDKYRVPLVLCYLQGKTAAQAGQELGCPVRTLERRLAQGRDLLRQRLLRRGLTLGAAALTAPLFAEISRAAVPEALARATAHGATLLVAGGPVAQDILTAQAVDLANVALHEAATRKLLRLAALLLVLGAAGAVLALTVPRGKPSAAVAGSSGEIRRSAFPFRRAAFAPDNRMLALADEDGGVEVYDLDYTKPTLINRLKFRLDEPGPRRSCVAVSPDGKKLAVGTLAGTVQLWDLGAGTKLATLQTAQRGEVTHLAFAPDGQALAALVAGKQGGLTTWTLATQTERCRVPLTDVVGVHLVFTPRNELFVVNEQYLLYAWDASTGQPLPVNAPAIPGVRGSRALAVAADGSVVVACAAEDGTRTVRLWQRGARDMRTLFALALDAKLSVLASPQGDSIACHFHNDNRVVVWDVALNRRLHEIRRPFEGGITCLAYSPDGKRLFWSGYGEERKPGMTSMPIHSGVIYLDVMRRELAPAKDK
jgi:RNA polymerase sigma factor (sigma-70 family)